MGTATSMFCSQPNQFQYNCSLAPVTALLSFFGPHQTGSRFGSCINWKYFLNGPISLDQSQKTVLSLHQAESQPNVSAGLPGGSRSGQAEVMGSNAAPSHNNSVAQQLYRWTSCLCDKLFRSHRSVRRRSLEEGFPSSESIRQAATNNLFGLDIIYLKSPKGKKMK